MRKIAHIFNNPKKYFRQFPPVGFAASMRPPAFDGVKYKTWRARATLWFETMKYFHAAKGKPEGELSPEEEKAFQEADTLLRAAILSILGDKIVDPYLSITTARACGMRSRPNLGSWMQAVNCMSWSSSLATR